ncbi:hypothetical protein, partial [Aerococcus urinae]|uniref:hypothetical protein n=1 Tax=Aerococcus urinae TaxID=1376 RepID=UPI00254C7D88
IGRVAGYAPAWIEIAPICRHGLNWPVAGYAPAWIEILLLKLLIIHISSQATRLRGLKLRIVETMSEIRLSQTSRMHGLKL